MVANTPRIESLPQDIYKVLEKGVVLSDEDCLSLAKIIQQQTAPQDNTKGVLRMSNFGDPCNRKLWYTVNKPEEAEQIEGRALFNFMYGHIIEALVIMLAEKAGHSVDGKQETIEINGVKGHRDGIFDGVLADVKSANSRSIKKFKHNEVREDDPFGYIDQLFLYLEGSKNHPALKINGEAAFIAVDKELGHIYVDKYKKDKDRDYSKEIDDKRSMLASATPPNRPFDPMLVDRGANLAIPQVPCGYCAFKKVCYSDANKGEGLKKYVTSRGPRWYIKITKEPDALKVEG